MKTISIAKDFSDTPGGRNKTDGPNSGEKFREEILEPAFITLADKDKLQIDLDGTHGYPPSFIDETFGGLARKYGSQKVLDKLLFKSDEEPNLIIDILEYIKNGKTNL